MLKPPPCVSDNSFRHNANRRHTRDAMAVAVTDFKYGESTAVLAEVGIPNRNYMNLLEFPVLAFGASNAVLVVLWIQVGLHL